MGIGDRVGNRASVQGYDHPKYKLTSACCANKVETWLGSLRSSQSCHCLSFSITEPEADDGVTDDGVTGHGVTGDGV